MAKGKLKSDKKMTQKQQIMADLEKIETLGLQMELATKSDEEDEPDSDLVLDSKPIRAHHQQAATSRSGLRSKAIILKTREEPDISSSTYDDKVKQLKMKTNSDTQDKVSQIRSSILSLTKVNTFFK